MKPPFPIFVDLNDRPCVVIGGGEVAARKVRSLLNAGARVTVVALEASAEMRTLLEDPAVGFEARAYHSGDLAGNALAFAATDDAATNASVYEEAMELGIPVNVADDPQHCSFLVPSKVERGPVTIAISTRGTSPALARHLREKLEAAVPQAYGELAALLGHLRLEVKAAHDAPEERARRWNAVVESDVLSLLEQGKAAEAEREARRLLGLPPEAEGEA
jgi:uroporphyrin-III C-methyltransferase/precorrin-2 dehydrogenase/sirohydrochlorin ferrochelatase